jgi:hypothetical protein
MGRYHEYYALVPSPPSRASIVSHVAVLAVPNRHHAIWVYPYFRKQVHNASRPGCRQFPIGRKCQGANRNVIGKALDLNGITERF